MPYKIYPKIFFYFISCQFYYTLIPKFYNSNLISFLFWKANSGKSTYLFEFCDWPDTELRLLLLPLFALNDLPTDVWKQTILNFISIAIKFIIATSACQIARLVSTTTNLWWFWFIAFYNVVFAYVLMHCHGTIWNKNVIIDSRKVNLTTEKECFVILSK